MDHCEFQDELGDILRKPEVIIRALSCIVQTLWQCQVIIEATVPIIICHLDKKLRQTCTNKSFSSKRKKEI